jgi:hypothetical protein
VYIRVSTFIVTFTVALIGIFLHVDDLKVKIALACLATASFVLAIFVEIQASREASFTKRSLERLIQASTPSDLFADAVKEIVLKQATSRGLGRCLVLNREMKDGYEIDMIFTDEAALSVVGYFSFSHEQLAKWSILEEKSLPKEIAADMFTRGPVPTPDLESHWNEMTDFIGEVAKRLYPDSLRDGSYGIWSDVDKGEIGVPYPRSVKGRVSERTKERPFNGQPVFVLTFPKEDLTALAAQSNIAASKIVADWLAISWGTPTVLTGVRA